MKNNNALEQIKELDRRLGKEIGAQKERMRLHRMINRSEKPQKDTSKDHNLKGKKNKEKE